MTMKCEYCKKKVGVITFDCKCEYKTLCKNCFHPEKHSCKVNYHNLYKKELNDKNPVVIGEKMEKI